MGYIKIFFGVLGTLAIIIFGIVRIAVEAIGWTTTPADLEALIDKMPALFSWLFSTPWPAPTILMALLAAGSAWLFWSGTRKTVADEITEQTGLNEDQVKQLITAALDLERGGTEQADNAHDLNDQLEKLEKRVEHFGMVIDAVGHGMLLDQAAKPEIIDRELDKIAAHAGLDLETQGIVPSPTDKYFREEFEKLGGDAEKLKRTIEAERARIMADSTYLYLTDDERKNWASGQQKRNHFLTMAGLAAKKAAYMEAYLALAAKSKLGADRLKALLDRPQ